MEEEFWHTRWENNQIAFHEGEGNVLMHEHFGALGVEPGARVFVPLCGKSRDLGWLMAQGYRVVGVELSPLAVEQLFSELELSPKQSPQGPLEHYAAAGLDVFVGDFFDLTAEALGPVDAVYDRAALVALPEGMRDDYARRVTALAGGAPQFLVCFEYEQSEMDGPPFSIDETEVRRLYGETHEITPLARRGIEGGLKGRVTASEAAWALRPR